MISARFDFSALVGRRGGVAAWNARAATATPLIQYLAPGSPDAGSGVFPRLFGSLLLSGAMALSAAAQNAPGVTDQEIKIGQTMPYTGPGARFSVSGLAEKAYMQMINDQGGINGRKINLISVDDGFMPWRTGNETRKLIEVEQVAFIFGSIGTTTQLSVAKYLNERKIPQLFIESGAYRWGRYKDTPYTIGGVRPSYRLGARLYVRHILKQDPNAKICILYEDNDYGRDYTAGARDVLGDKYAATVKEATYELHGCLDRPADRRAQGHRLQCADRGHYPAARRAGNPQGARSRLETDFLHEQCVGLGARYPRAGRAREQHRFVVIGLWQGPARS